MNKVKSSSLTVGYGPKTVLSDINFDLSKGEIICLMGPNGSGKSTIIKTITKHIKKIGGNVYFSQMDVDKLSHKEIAKELSVVLTERINPELMTAAEVIATGRYPHTNYLGKLNEKDFQIINDSIEMVNGENLRNKFFSKLSDGQKQRVMLARAICQEADVMILDEPTSFLDVRYKIELLGILRRLASEFGKTIILSLHEIDLIPKIADKVILIGEDERYIYGTPEDVINDQTVKDAFGINVGTFSTLIGNIELSKSNNKPKVFVLSGEGKGTEVFRILNKNGMSFYTGVVFENDIDLIVANSLAEIVISNKSFQKISEEKIQEAKSLIDEVEIFIDVGSEFVGINRGNKKLLIHALENNKEIITLKSRDETPKSQVISLNILNKRLNEEERK